MKNTFRTRLLPLVAGLTLITGALAGCGGSGNGPAALRPAVVTLNGTLQDSGGGPLVGYKVVYNPGGVQPQARVSPRDATVLSTVTDSQGRYTLVIPAAQITGHDALAFYDATGALAQTQMVTLDPGQTGIVSSQPVVTTVPLPPTPPAGSV